MRFSLRGSLSALKQFCEHGFDISVGLYLHIGLDLCVGLDLSADLLGADLDLHIDLDLSDPFPMFGQQHFLQLRKLFQRLSQNLETELCTPLSSPPLISTSMTIPTLPPQALQPASHLPEQICQKTVKQQQQLQDQT